MHARNGARKCFGFQRPVTKTPGDWTAAVLRGSGAWSGGAVRGALVRKAVRLSVSGRPARSAAAPAHASFFTQVSGAPARCYVAFPGG